MNIIITGPKHCGKSTVIRKILGSFSGSVSGFISEFDNRTSSTRELLLRNITDSLSRCAVSWIEGQPEVHPEVFDLFATELIDTESDLIVIDELGKFEKSCHSLEETVCKAFDSSCPVLASIRLDAAGWMQELKNRDDVILINIDDTNRDSIPASILEMLTNNCWNR